MRRALSLLILLATASVAVAAGTNYTCVVCGKSNLVGIVWLSKWGTICDACYQTERHCAICDLPIRPGDDFAKTGDGRYICRFDKPAAVLEADEAKEVFAEARRKLVDLFGEGFALKYPDVTVNLFDVDYWTEPGHSEGLHRYGFANTRKSYKTGECTHEVMLLSGQLRRDMTAIAAHEYTHLWINENCPTNHVMELDTIEGVCELTTYLLMAEERQDDIQKRIWDNPYTHGKIKTLVALEEHTGIAPILNWVKNGTTATLTDTIPSYPVATNAVPPPSVPDRLRYTGMSVIGTQRAAIINGRSFVPGQQRRVPLGNRSVLVSCRIIGENAVIVQTDDAEELTILKKEQ